MVDAISIYFEEKSVVGATLIWHYIPILIIHLSLNCHDKDPSVEFFRPDLVHCTGVFVGIIKSEVNPS